MFCPKLGAVFQWVIAQLRPNIININNKLIIIKIIIIIIYLNNSPAMVLILILPSIFVMDWVKNRSYRLLINLTGEISNFSKYFSKKSFSQEHTLDQLIFQLLKQMEIDFVKKCSAIYFKGLQIRHDDKIYFLNLT